MRSRLLALATAALLAAGAQVLYPGCATLLDGSSKEVRVKSRPAAAKVFVDGHLVGTTPLMTEVSRWGFHKLRIEAPGFEPLEVPLVKHFNLDAGANWFFPPGIVLDLATGAIFELEVSSKVKPRLSQIKEPALAFSGSTLTIVADLRPQQHGRLLGNLQMKH